MDGEKVKDIKDDNNVMLSENGSHKSNSPVKLKRVKVRAEQAKKSKPKKNYGNIIAVGMFLFGILLVINPFTYFVPPLTTPSLTNVSRNILDGFVYNNGHLWIAVFCFGSTLIYSAWNGRNNYANNPLKWSNHCPQCETNKLKRMRRKPHHRIKAILMYLPIRYYICPNCGWKGSRVDHHHLTP